MRARALLLLWLCARTSQQEPAAADGCLPSLGALPPSLAFCNGSAVGPSSWPARRAQIAALLQATM